MDTSTVLETGAGTATRRRELEEFVLERLFGETYYRFDLVEGEIFNPADVRIIYLSADVVRGIYEALNFEAGEAWKVILKTCGHLWAKRVANSLEQEYRAIAQHDWDDLNVAQYVELMEAYFSRHGWGKVKVVLDDAAEYGIVRVSMTHSLFATALNNVEGPVDFMIAGMLQGIFETISEQTLEALEVQSPRRNAAPGSEFLISAPERIASIENLVEEGAPLDDIIERLRQA